MGLLVLFWDRFISTFDQVNTCTYHYTAALVQSVKSLQDNHLESLP